MQISAHIGYNPIARIGCAFGKRGLEEGQVHEELAMPL